MKKHPTIAIYSGVSISTTFIERLIEGLVEAGTHIYIFGSDSGKSMKHNNLHYVIHGKKWHKLFILIKYTILLFLFKPREKKMLDAIIDEKYTNKLLWQLKFYPVLYHQPDIFHIQWAKGLDDWIWVQDFSMKLVLSLRGAHINYSPIADSKLAAMYKKNFPKVDAFHAVSKAIAEEATKYGAPLERIKIVKSGLSARDYPFVLKTAVLEGTLNILSVGRNHWIKNYSLALDVMSVLKSKNIDFHYSIIGMDDNEGLLFQREQLQLKENVSFIKTLPFNEVQIAIKSADVLLLPSLKEGIANVVLESMMLGTLVISSDCGGMAEAIKPSQTGYLVPIRDIEAMACAIEEVIELPLEAYQKMIMNARTSIEKQHSTEGMITDMLDLYHEITVDNL